LKKIEEAIKVFHHFKVKPEDAPVFNKQIIHKVCSTYKLAQEAEWAGRQVLLQLLENDEEGIGSAILLKHLGPAHFGSLITIEAWPLSLAGNKLICSFEARIGQERVAEGETEQVILPRMAIDKLLKNN